jgi:hypothetical protein
MAYLTATKYMRNDLILQHEPEAEHGPEDEGISVPNNIILEALEMMTCISIRQIAKMTIIPGAAVFRRLAKSIHFVLT